MKPSCLILTGKTAEFSASSFIDRDTSDEGLDNEKGTCSLIDLPTSLESGIQPIGSME